MRLDKGYARSGYMYSLVYPVLYRVGGRSIARGFKRGNALPTPQLYKHSLILQVEVLAGRQKTTFTQVVRSKTADSAQQYSDHTHTTWWMKRETGPRKIYACNSSIILFLPTGISLHLQVMYCMYLSKIPYSSPSKPPGSEPLFRSESMITPSKLQGGA